MPVDFGEAKSDRWSRLGSLQLSDTWAESKASRPNDQHLHPSIDENNIDCLQARKESRWIRELLPARHTTITFVDTFSTQSELTDTGEEQKVEGRHSESNSEGKTQNEESKVRSISPIRLDNEEDECWSISPGTTSTTPNMFLVSTYLGEMTILRKPWSPTGKDDKVCEVTRDGVACLSIPPEEESQPKTLEGATRESKGAKYISEAVYAKSDRRSPEYDSKQTRDMNDEYKKSPDKFCFARDTK
jgi:hypothetical protein